MPVTHLRFAAETDARVEEESAEHRGALVAATKRPPKLDSGAALLDRISETYQDAPDTSATGEIMRDFGKELLLGQISVNLSGDA